MSNSANKEVWSKQMKKILISVSVLIQMYKVWQKYAYPANADV